MMAGRMSDVIEMAPFAGWSPAEIRYCRRVSAYLGLSVETIVSMARTGAKQPNSNRLGERRPFKTARPR
jgi:hypothetical protein